MFLGRFFRLWLSHGHKERHRPYWSGVSINLRLEEDVYLGISSIRGSWVSHI